ncbi:MULTISPECIES: hypothetical protein [Aquimarina]|uniref:hypothetical protein n=1 Tax=Aquimarina TaxID=290174 RepID=UPI000AD9080A|nr:MULTISPECIES: hypothetical protein [Aquimarina]
MKKKKLSGLLFDKKTISKLESMQIKGGRNTAISYCRHCGQAPSQRPSCNDE